MEFALVLPLLVTVMWLGVESVLLVRDQTLVTHAAREGARAAAVGASLAEVTAVAGGRSGLGGQDGLTVGLNVLNGVAEVTVQLDEAPRLPLIGRLAPSLRVTALIAMRMEAPG